MLERCFSCYSDIYHVLALIEVEFEITAGKVIHEVARVPETLFQVPVTLSERHLKKNLGRPGSFSPGVSQRELRELEG
jgi:hypothetical protein